MNTDKAYLFGLIIGGGVFGNAEDAFKIRLPFKKWGSYLENPKRAGQISRDIMNVVSPMFRNTYGIIVSFETNEKVWDILCDGDITSLKEELEMYGISLDGEIRTNVDINKLCAGLVDDNLKRRFIAGLADSLGSMAKSHRRFTADNQILSLEIKGFNFNFVCDLCRLLHSINCIPDQVNWNHPNIQCPNNPFYRAWNKGFKLRILLDQFACFGAFAFRTKAESLNENLSLQQQTHVALPCYEQKINITPSCVHPAENDIRLPEQIRDGHYIHYRHFCAVLGCEHAQSEQIVSHFTRLGELIYPFPIQCKDTTDVITAMIASDPLMDKRTYSDVSMNVSSLLIQYRADNNVKLYGTSSENGYSIREILQAVAFIIAEDGELFGKRPRGYINIIEKHIQINPSLTVLFRKPDLLTPLVIIGNGRGALIGAKNPKVYEKLVTRAPENDLKLLVRPITEEDLRNA